MIENGPGMAQTTRTPKKRRKTFLPLDLLDSIWLGITLATLLFFYCSIGSAMPAVRQLPSLEMTEFEWFHWWPFNVLIVLLCLNVTVVTIRRIPLRLANLGVWAIHAGIIVLCIGSYYYFGTKVEGDTPVFRRRVVVNMPGMDHAVEMVALPGNQVSAVVGPDVWRFQVQSTNAAWPILSDEHKGESAYAVNVMVSPPSGDRFIRQLLAGYPQYTEDVIPGRGRAIKSLGRKLINEDLSLTLEYEPQPFFHVMDTWALYTRKVGETQWVQRPIHGLPRFNDRIGSRDQVFTDPHYPVPLRAIDLLVPAPEGGDAMSSATLRITGYLRYANMQQRWRDGGSRLNPVVQMTVLSSGSPPETHELVAFDRAHQTANDGMIELRWLDGAGGFADLPADSRALLSLAVPGQNVSVTVPITSESLAGADGPFTDIEGTGFAYRLRNVQDNLVLPGDGRSVSIAMVDIRTPDGQFTRMVADRPEMTRDMHGDGDPHSAGRSPVAADARIVAEYRPGSAPIIVAAYPNGLHLVVNGPNGRMLGRDVSVGEIIEVVPGLRLRADAFWPRAVSEAKPYVVPPSQRQRNVREALAKIRLEVTTSAGTRSEWLSFAQYALPNEQYAYSGRFAYNPEVFRLPGGDAVEVLFSRERRRLPTSIALSAFDLDTHIGGYTGDVSTIRNYVSQLAFLTEGGTWTKPEPIRVNGPTEYGGYWYFQSSWDKPSRNDPGGGMNYTGLGVGNRNGVYIQLAGCCLSVAGMIFAFYVKPVIRRRRHERSRARVAGKDAETSAEPEAVVDVAATVEV